MSISKGQLLSLIEKLPISAQVTTYYYLKDLSYKKMLHEEMEYEYPSFIHSNESNKEDMYWIDAFMEFHFDKN